VGPIETLPPIEVTAPRIHAAPLASPSGFEQAVTGLRHEADTFQTPVAITVQPKGEIRERRMARSVPDALLRIPSVMVQKTGPGQSSPFIRGFTGYHNLMLVDGIRLNNSVFREGPNQYWSTVDSYSIERLEVLRGPHSVLYGSDAVGGTVNAFPRRRHSFQPGFHMNGGAGTRASSAENAFFGRLEGEGNVGGVGWVAGATGKRYGDVVSGDGLLPETAWDEWDADARVDVRRGPHWTWTFGFQHVRQIDVPRTHTTVFAVPFAGSAVGSELRRDLDQQRDLLYARAAYEGCGPLERAAFTVSWHRQQEEQDRLRTGNRRDLSGFDVHTLGVQAQVEHCTRFGRLTWGLDWYHDEVDSFRDDFVNDVLTLSEVQGPVGDDARYDLVGAYVQDEVRLGPVDLVGGLRLTYAAGAADRVDDPQVAGSDPATPGNVMSVDGDWTSLVGSLRALWHVNRSWNVYGGVSQAFRAPTLSDLTAFETTSVVEFPTPTLDAEDYLCFELGTKVERRSVSANAAVWYTLLDDTIVRSPTGVLIGGIPEVRKDNIGDGWILGLELEGAVRLSPCWTTFGVFSWMDGEVDQYTAAQQLIRGPVSRLQPPTGVVGLRFEPPGGRFWAQGEWVIAGKQDDLSEKDKTDTQRIPPGGTPGYSVVHLRAGYAITPDVHLSAAVENVFDRNYRIHGSGVNEPGLNVILALEVSW
jgi:hemoglobin/transferrin/lactoferrin receptor protein